MLAYGVPTVGHQPKRNDLRRYGCKGVSWRTGPKTRTRRRWKKAERRHVCSWLMAMIAEREVARG